MRIVIRDRNGAVPEPVRRGIERKLAQLNRHLDLLAEAEVELDREAQRSGRPVHVVEITVRGIAPHLRAVRATESGRDLSNVIDLALDKLDREILKLKERLKSHP
ncbi:MAG TPA: ribosome-associated translation inhibitor RaiA [Candidatus Dormibacteraeota bacterium]|jgi:ribosomal subunit interface protein|nr:ribosome-associated translation inhibitor RaiA [Candidatus Dormibacteraeota bacterium]